MLEEQSVNSTQQGELIKLGAKINNPYSVKTMQNAYNELLVEGIIKSSTSKEELIPTTHLYVRFLPQNFDELCLLTDSLHLMLFDHSLLYEIEQDGEYYHDPSLPENIITWQYTTVNQNFNFPKVQYEIIEECFIPSECEYTKNSLVELIEERALQITGFLKKDVSRTDNEIGSKGLSLERPTGVIKFQDPNRSNNSVNAKSITIRCWVGAKIGRGITDNEGYYSCNKKFRVGPYYRLYFYRNNDWSIKHNTISLSVAKNIGLGYHNKKGFSKTFTASGDKNDIPFFIVSTAAHDYFKWCEDNGILKPHNDLRIWVASFVGCSAPMMSKVTGPLWVLGNPNHVHLDDVDGWGTFAKTILFTGLANQANVITYILGLRPDITLTHSTTCTSLYRSTMHELAHTSHMRKVGATYWSNYISYILTQWVNKQDTYGNKEALMSGICGVCESWGYFFGGMMASNEFGGYKFTGDSYWFCPQIHRQLTGIYSRPDYPRLTNSLSAKQIFDCLTSDVKSHEQLCYRLTSKYGRNNEIESIFTSLGF